MSAFAPGARVVHARYGVGTVKALAATLLGQAAQLHVNFLGDRYPVPRRVWAADLTALVAVTLAVRTRPVLVLVRGPEDAA